DQTLQLFTWESEPSTHGPSVSGWRPVALRSSKHPVSCVLGRLLAKRATWSAVGDATRELTAGLHSLDTSLGLLSSFQRPSVYRFAACCFPAFPSGARLLSPLRAACQARILLPIRPRSFRRFAAKPPFPKDFCAAPAVWRGGDS